MAKVKVSKRQLDELVDDNGALISSNVPDNAMLQSTIQHSTTDDHVKSARQQMIWMQYRRYYGEGKKKSKYTLMADKYANHPEKFYRFLERKGDQKEFSKYFTKVKHQNVLNEAASETHDDYPKQAVKNAKKALDWRDEHGRDEVAGGTRVGWKRANQLTNGTALSIETIRRMKNFFDRHDGDQKINDKHKNEPWKDNGYVSWLLWGGDAGRKWAEKKIKQYEKKQQNEVYTIDDIDKMLLNNGK
jgi:hypothetical protein